MQELRWKRTNPRTRYENAWKARSNGHLLVIQKKISYGGKTSYDWEIVTDDYLQWRKRSGTAYSHSAARRQVLSALDQLI